MSRPFWAEVALRIRWKARRRIMKYEQDLSDARFDLLKIIEDAKKLVGFIREDQLRSVRQAELMQAAINALRKNNVYARSEIEKLRAENELLKLRLNNEKEGQHNGESTKCKVCGNLGCVPDLRAQER